MRVMQYRCGSDDSSTPRLKASFVHLIFQAIMPVRRHVLNTGS